MINPNELNFSPIEECECTCSSNEITNYHIDESQIINEPLYKQVKANIICTLCMNFAVDPCLCSSCEGLFCLVCLTNGS